MICPAILLPCSPLPWQWCFGNVLNLGHSTSHIIMRGSQCCLQIVKSRACCYVGPDSGIFRGQSPDQICEDFNWGTPIDQYSLFWSVRPSMCNSEVHVTLLKLLKSSQNLRAGQFGLLGHCSWLTISRTALGPQCYYPRLSLLLYGSSSSLWRPALEAGRLQCSPGMLSVQAAEGLAPRIQACRCCRNFSFRCRDTSNLGVQLTCRSLRKGCQSNVRAMPSLLTFSPVWRELCGVSGSAQQDRVHEPRASAFSTLALHAGPSTAGPNAALPSLQQWPSLREGGLALQTPFRWASSKIMRLRHEAQADLNLSDWPCNHGAC